MKMQQKQQQKTQHQEQKEQTDSHQQEQEYLILTWKFQQFYKVRLWISFVMMLVAAIFLTRAFSPAEFITAYISQEHLQRIQQINSIFNDSIVTLDTLHLVLEEILTNASNQYSFNNTSNNSENNTSNSQLSKYCHAQLSYTDCFDFIMAVNSTSNTAINENGIDNLLINNLYAITPSFRCVTGACQEVEVLVDYFWKLIAEKPYIEHIEIKYASINSTSIALLDNMSNYNNLNILLIPALATQYHQTLQYQPNHIYLSLDQKHALTLTKQYYMLSKNYTSVLLLQVIVVFNSQYLLAACNLSTSQFSNLDIVTTLNYTSPSLVSQFSYRTSSLIETSENSISSTFVIESRFISVQASDLGSDLVCEIRLFTISIAAISLTNNSLALFILAVGMLVIMHVILMYYVNLTISHSYIDKQLFPYFHHIKNLYRLQINQIFENKEPTETALLTQGYMRHFYQEISSILAKSYRPITPQSHYPQSMLPFKFKTFIHHLKLKYQIYARAIFKEKFDSILNHKYFIQKSITELSQRTAIKLKQMHKIARSLSLSAIFFKFAYLSILEEREQFEETIKNDRSPMHADFLGLIREINYTIKTKQQMLQMFLINISNQSEISSETKKQNQMRYQEALLVKYYQMIRELDVHGEYAKLLGLQEELRYMCESMDNMKFLLTLHNQNISSVKNYK